MFKKIPCWCPESKTVRYWSEVLILTIHGGMYENGNRENELRNRSSRSASGFRTGSWRSGLLALLAWDVCASGDPTPPSIPVLGQSLASTCPLHEGRSLESNDVQAVHDGGNRPSDDKAQKHQHRSRHAVFLRSVDMNPTIKKFQHWKSVAHIRRARQALLEWLFTFRRLAIKTQNIMATGSAYVAPHLPDGCGVR
jgi:hypothetical protein